MNNKRNVFFVMSSVCDVLRIIRTIIIIIPFSIGLIN